MIDYKYKNFINDINSGVLKCIVFSIKDYPHYKKCVIERKFEYIFHGQKQIVSIVVNLVEDNSEKVSFLDTF